MRGLVIAAFLAALAARAETAFDGMLFVSTTWKHEKTVGAAKLTETLPMIYSWGHENGTNAWQMNAFVSRSETLAAGATNAVTLGRAVNGFGDPVTFARVAFLAVKASRSNAADVVVGGAAEGAFEPWTDAPGSTLAVKPGGLLVLTAPSTNGYWVGSNTNLMIRNASTSVGALYDLYIGGAQ